MRIVQWSILTLSHHVDVRWELLGLIRFTVTVMAAVPRDRVLTVNGKQLNCGTDDLTDNDLSELGGCPASGRMR